MISMFGQYGVNVEKVVSLPTAKTETSDDWGALLAEMAETADRKIFVKLFQHFAPLLKAYLIRLGLVESVVEELVQEAMLTVWRKAKSYDPNRAAAGAWVYTVARNLAIDWMRKQKYPTYSLESWHEDDHHIETDPGEKKVVEEKMAKAIKKLPEEQAQVIYMSFYEGRSHTEISARLGIPLGSVKSRIRLAADKLRNYWEPQL